MLCSLSRLSRPDNAPGAGGTTCSNLFQLSAEDPDGDGHGRLYNIARTQQNPPIMFSDDNGATWQYGGQLTEPPAATPVGNNYVNGYFKYVSNGIDRIDLIATEYHPRDFNTSIYHATIQNGKMYDSQGKEIHKGITADGGATWRFPGRGDSSQQRRGMMHAMRCNAL